MTGERYLHEWHRTSRDANNGHLEDRPGDLQHPYEAIDTYTLKIGARRTVRLLYYAAFSNAHISRVPVSDFDSAAKLRSSGMLVGLSSSFRAQVRNWKNL